MPFQNIPLKSIQAEVVDVQGTESLPWTNPLLLPVPPGDPAPPTVPRDYRWQLTIQITFQTQSSNLTRDPGFYNGQDVSVGQWIAGTSTGQVWQIISVLSKNVNGLVVIVEDIYRYNTFRDPSQNGNGAPISGTYVIFELNDSGVPIIDPVPPSGTSADFGTNLSSRFEYINLQYDFPVYVPGNTFSIEDVIAADPVGHTFVEADADHRTVVGRVTSLSDIKPGWITINPVQKIVDYLDFLPGSVGDIIYSSITSPGTLTTSSTEGTQVYIKLRDNTQSLSDSTAPGPTTPGNVFLLNNIYVTVNGSGTTADVVSAVNPLSSQTGVTVSLIQAPNSVATDPSLINTLYGEAVMWAITSPAIATINGSSVTFNILSTDPGYENYTRPPQMVQAINNAAISGIVASSTDNAGLTITNTTGGAITIVNIQSDVNGVPFGGSDSGSGLALFTPATSNHLLEFIAVDARAINFLDVIGSPTLDFGLTSTENGIKAAGLYIAQGLRQSITTVVSNLTQLNALSPLIGDSAYVIDSNDGSGNNVGQWSIWLWDGVMWVETSTQASAGSDAKTFQYESIIHSTNNINIGRLSTGRRVTLITVNVTSAFDAGTMSIGYTIGASVNSTALMDTPLIDLTVIGTYITTTDILFGTDTITGDVTITMSFIGTATTGVADIAVSYV